MFRYINNGHEYRVIEQSDGLAVKNNYGRVVAFRPTGSKRTYGDRDYRNDAREVLNHHEGIE